MSAAVSEILPNKISSFNGCKNLCFRKTKQIIYYLLALHLLKSFVEEAVSEMLCCKSATERSAVTLSDLVVYLYFYVGFVFVCSFGVFYVTVAHMSNNDLNIISSWYWWCPLCSVLSSDHQKLEREARICRLLKHPNIGESFVGAGRLMESLIQKVKRC